MAKKKEETGGETEVKVTPKKGFQVLDSNGKVIRVLESREGAEELAKIVGGSLK